MIMKCLVMREVSWLKLDILVNKEEVDALSFIVFEGSAYERGRKMCEKLKKRFRDSSFEIPIQAAIGSKIIARETVEQCEKMYLQNAMVEIFPKEKTA